MMKILDIVEKIMSIAAATLAFKIYLDDRRKNKKATSKKEASQIIAKEARPSGRASK